MWEMIRKMVMSRIQTKRQMMLRDEGLLCPKIHDKLEKLIEDSRNCLVTYAGEQMYEVDCFPRTYIVNLQRQTCLCRQWDVTGIPCIHAIACIFKFNMRPQNYVDPCYRIETYLRSYANMIYPIPDSSQWEATGSNPIAPHLYRIQPRRPKKARRRAPDELANKTKVRRYGISLRCNNCKQYGHNISTCKNPRVEAVERSHRGGRPPLKVGSIGASGRTRGSSRRNPVNDVGNDVGMSVSDSTGRGRAVGRGSTRRGRSMGRGSTGRGRVVGRGSSGRGRSVGRRKTRGMGVAAGRMGATAQGKTVEGDVGANGMVAARGKAAEIGAVVWARTMVGDTASAGMAVGRGRGLRRSASGTQNVHTVKWFGSSSQVTCVIFFHIVQHILQHMYEVEKKTNCREYSQSYHAYAWSYHAYA